MIKFPPCEPDKSEFNPTGSNSVVNVLPVADGWGPMPSFQILATALPSKCLGGIYGQDSSGAYHIFAGTATALYKYNSGTLSWDDISQASTTYAVPDGDYWSFLEFGDIIICTNISDGPQYFDMGSSVKFASLAGSPPKAKHVFNVGEFVVLANLSTDQQGLVWSAIGDSTGWTSGVNLSGGQHFPDGGAIQAGISAELGAVIIQENSKRSMIFAPGTEYVMNFRVINSKRGAVSQASVVPISNTFFYLAEDGFYKGIESDPIGAERVNRSFLKEIKDDGILTVQGAADPVTKMVWWLYETPSQSKMIGYDWQLDRWTFVETDIEYLLPTVTSSLSPDSMTDSPDDWLFSPDSRVWQGGRPTFGGFNLSHEFGYFSGPSMAAEIETPDIELAGEGLRYFLNGYRFVTDLANHSGVVSSKDTHASARVWSAEMPPTRTGMITPRVDARLHRFLFKAPAGEVWSHVHGVEFQGEVSGAQ